MDCPSSTGASGSFFNSSSSSCYARARDSSRTFCCSSLIGASTTSGAKEETSSAGGCYSDILKLLKRKKRWGFGVSAGVRANVPGMMIGLVKIRGVYQTIDFSLGI